jgi:hypothetical protein
LRGNDVPSEFFFWKVKTNTTTNCWRSNKHNIQLHHLEIPVHIRRTNHFFKPQRGNEGRGVVRGAV